MCLTWKMLRHHIGSLSVVWTEGALFVRRQDRLSYNYCHGPQMSWGQSLWHLLLLLLRNSYTLFLLSLILSLKSFSLVTFLSMIDNFFLIFCLDELEQAASRISPGRCRPPGRRNGRRHRRRGAIWRRLAARRRFGPSDGQRGQQQRGQDLQRQQHLARPGNFD